MNLLFKNTLYFSIIYFSVFFLDTLIKINLEAFPYRYISKFLLIFLLLIFYVKNQKEENLKKTALVIVALICFIIGDAFLTASSNNLKLFFVIGVCFFGLAKVLYSLRFSNKQDFNTLKLLPFLLFCFAYMSVVMSLVYSNLGDYFLPALLYLFIVMLVAQFAYLRKKEVNKESYWFVLIGIILSMFSDSITILKEFYSMDIAYNHITIMLFYGMSQYFIVIGILKENNTRSSIQ